MLNGVGLIRLTPSLIYTPPCSMSTHAFHVFFLPFPPFFPVFPAFSFFSFFPVFPFDSYGSAASTARSHLGPDHAVTLSITQNCAAGRQSILEQGDESLRSWAAA